MDPLDTLLGDDFDVMEFLGQTREAPEAATAPAAAAGSHPPAASQASSLTYGRRDDSMRPTGRRVPHRYCPPTSVTRTHPLVTSSGGAAVRSSRAPTAASSAASSSAAAAGSLPVDADSWLPLVMQDEMSPFEGLMHAGAEAAEPAAVGPQPPSARSSAPTRRDQWRHAQSMQRPADGIRRPHRYCPAPTSATQTHPVATTGGGTAVRRSRGAIGATLTAAAEASAASSAAAAAASRAPPGAFESPRSQLVYPRRRSGFLSDSANPCLESSRARSPPRRSPSPSWPPRSPPFEADELRAFDPPRTAIPPAEAAAASSLASAVVWPPSPSYVPTSPTYSPMSPPRSPASPPFAGLAAGHSPRYQPTSPSLRFDGRPLSPSSPPSPPRELLRPLSPSASMVQPSWSAARMAPLLDGPVASSVPRRRRMRQEAMEEARARIELRQATSAASRRARAGASFTESTAAPSAASAPRYVPMSLGPEITCWDDIERDLSQVEHSLSQATRTMLSSAPSAHPRSMQFQRTAPDAAASMEDAALAASMPSSGSAVAAAGATTHRKRGRVLQPSDSAVLFDSASAADKRTNMGSGVGAAVRSDPNQLLICGLDGRFTALQMYHPSEWQLTTIEDIMRLFAHAAHISPRQMSQISLSLNGRHMQPHASLADYVLFPDDSSITVLLQVLGRPLGENSDVLRFHESVTQLKSSLPPRKEITKVRNALAAVLSTIDVTAEKSLDAYLGCCSCLLESNTWALVHVGIEGLGLAAATARLSGLMPAALRRFVEQCDVVVMIMRVVEHEGTIDSGVVEQPKPVVARASAEEKHAEGGGGAQESGDGPRMGGFEELSFAKLELEFLQRSSGTTAAARRARSRAQQSLHGAQSRALGLSIDPESSLHGLVSDSGDVLSSDSDVSEDYIRPAVAPPVPVLQRSRGASGLAEAMPGWLPVLGAQPPPPAAAASVPPAPKSRVTLAQIVDSLRPVFKALCGNATTCFDLLGSVLTRFHEQVASARPFPPMLADVLCMLCDEVGTHRAAPICVDDRLRFVRLLLHCLHSIPAPVLSDRLLMPLSLMLGMFANLPANDRLHFATKMLPPDCSERDRTLAVDFSPLRSPTFGPEGLKDAGRQTRWAARQMLPPIARLACVPPELPPLDLAAHRHLVRRLLHFTFGRKDALAHVQEALLRGVYFVLQDTGHALFDFTEALVLRHLRSMIHVHCMPPILALHNLLASPVDTGSQPIRFCSAPTSAAANRPTFSMPAMEADNKPTDAAELAELAAWEQELEHFQAWAPDTSAELASAPDPLYVGGLSQLSQLSCLLAGKPTILRGGPMNRDCSQLICYLDAWRAVYSTMAREKTQQQAKADSAQVVCSMEFCEDDEKKTEAAAAPKAVAVSADAGVDDCAPARSFAALMAHTFHSASVAVPVDPPGSCTVLLNAWLQGSNEFPETPEDKAALDPFSAQLQLCMQKLDESMRALTSLASMELRFCDRSAFIMGATKLRSIHAPSARSIPPMLAVLLSVLLQFAPHSTLFPGLPSLLLRARRLIDDHALLLNLFVASDPHALQSHLGFLLHPLFLSRPSSASLQAQPLMARSSSMQARQAAGPTHLLQFAVREAFVQQNLQMPGPRDYYASASVTVSRNNVLMDAFESLGRMPANQLRSGSLSARFRNEPGAGPGVTREFLSTLIRSLFNPDFALWRPLPSDPSMFVPNAASGLLQERHLQFFTFTGRVLALAVLSKQKLECGIASACMQHVIGAPLDWKRLATQDARLYQSLNSLLEQSVADLDLTFSVTEEDEVMGRREVSLVDGGAEMAVTDANKQDYVRLYAEHRMIGSVREQLAAFKCGFAELVPLPRLSLFNPDELSIFLCGSPQLCVRDWRAHTSYEGYSDSSPVIGWFWSAVEQLTDSERANLLFFACSIGRLPASGFAGLKAISGASFKISKSMPVAGFAVDQTFPSARTCFLTLCLPDYSARSVVKDMIRTICSDRAAASGFSTG